MCIFVCGCGLHPQIPVCMRAAWHVQYPQVALPKGRLLRWASPQSAWVRTPLLATQAIDFGRGFLAATSSDIRRARGTSPADQDAPLRLSFKQTDRVPIGVVALVSRCHLTGLELALYHSQLSAAVNGVLHTALYKDLLGVPKASCMTSLRVSHNILCPCKHCV